MKRVLFVLVLMISVVALNAQTPKTTATHKKAAKTAINVVDLPKTITTNIAKDYPGFTVKSAKSYTGKKGLDYEVLIAKGTDNETVRYDKDGTLLKKESQKMATHHNSKKK